MRRARRRRVQSYNTIIPLKHLLSIVPTRINCRIHRVAGYPLIIYYLDIISQATPYSGRPNSKWPTHMPPSSSRDPVDESYKFRLYSRTEVDRI